GHLGNNRVPVIDGVEGARERWIGDLVLGGSGGHAAYVARRGPDVDVIVDGTPHRFDLVLDGTLQFDASGQHWGCIAGSRAERRLDIVIDGRRTSEVEVTEAIDVATRAQAA